MSSRQARVAPNDGDSILWTESLGIAWLTSVVLLGSAVAMAAGPDAAERRLEAQDESQAHRQDFRFAVPRMSVALRYGWMFRSEGSDIYDFFQEFLTIESGAFDSPQLDVDFALWLSPRSDLVFGFGYTSVDPIGSEFRNQRSISPSQTTALREVSLTVSYKYYLRLRGRQVGRLAWISNQAVPYVGVGGGLDRYQLTQSGGFVDVDTGRIFSDFLESKGWAPLVHFFGGFELRLRRSVFATFEGRYQLARANLREGFRDFEPLDLGGFGVTVGILVLF